LLVVAGSDRLLLRGDADGSLDIHVDLASRCDRPWNEIVVDGRGNVYLNSIGIDMMAGEDVARPGCRGWRGPTTVELDRGCFACVLGGADDRTLFMMAAEWRAPEGMADATPMDQVLTVEAPAPRAGWP
jgi:sugar lactone lactonase YvrE